VGRPIDEIVLNKALFEREGVKVLASSSIRLCRISLRESAGWCAGIGASGDPGSGVIPYNPMMARSTFEQIIEETNFEVLCGRSIWSGRYHSYRRRDEAHDAVKYISDDSLMITPATVRI